jgi:DNA-binding Lrp family transcriptional regulator
VEFESGGAEFAMDQLDQGILRCLHEDCRMSYEALGRELGTTSATIKNRVNKLKNSGMLGKLSIRLSCSAINGRRILIVIETDGTEQRNDFIGQLGNHPLTEWISSCGTKKYILQSVCCSIDEYSEFQAYLSSFPRITSLKMYPTVEPKEHIPELTKVNAEVLAHLVDDPRRKSTEITALCGKSSKSVSREIRRIRETGLMEFTIECFFSSLIAVVKHDGDSPQAQETLRKEFICLWESAESSIGSVVLAFFFLKCVDDLHLIPKNLKMNGFHIIDILIAEPRRYFSSVRDSELERLIETELTNC